MTNPYLARREQRKNRGILAEKRAGKRLGFSSQPGSGAVDGAKGDLKSASFLMESKATGNESLSLKKEWLDKISKEALDTTRTPAVIIQFVNLDGSPRKGGSWVMVPETVFQELIG